MLKCRMNIAIYWIDENNYPCVEFMGENDLGPALTRANTLRNAGYHHVSISTEFGNSVGKRGVSDKLPDNYDWKKRRI